MISHAQERAPTNRANCALDRSLRWTAELQGLPRRAVLHGLGAVSSPSFKGAMVDRPQDRDKDMVRLWGRSSISSSEEPYRIHDATSRWSHASAGLRTSR